MHVLSHTRGERCTWPVGNIERDAIDEYEGNRKSTVQRNEGLGTLMPEKNTAKGIPKETRIGSHGRLSN